MISDPLVVAHWAKRLMEQAVRQNLLTRMLSPSPQYTVEVPPAYFWLGAEADAEPLWGDYDDE